jgi:hypothetical protein
VLVSLLRLALLSFDSSRTRLKTMRQS